MDNYHSWRQVEKALFKLNYTFVGEALGYRNYRGVDGYLVQVKKSIELPLPYVVELCETHMGVPYRIFLQLITDKF